MQCGTIAATGTTRGFAIDRNDLRGVVAEAFDPGRKALRKHFRIVPVDHIVQRVTGRNTALERQKLAQEAELHPGTTSMTSGSGYSTFQAWRGSSRAEKCSIRLCFAAISVMAGSDDSKPSMNHSKFRAGIP